MKKLSVAGIVFGALLTLAPFWGLLGTVIGMVKSFETAGTAESMGDPSILADGISASLVPTVVGVVLCPLGIALLVVSIIAAVRLSKRKGHQAAQLSTA